MKLPVLLASTLLIGVCIASAAELSHSVSPTNGVVPDTQTAVAVAEAILIPIYGRDKILSERPFQATLEGGVWTVVGTLPPGLLGGVAIVEISKSDGSVRRISHGR